MTRPGADRVLPDLGWPSATADGKPSAYGRGGELSPAKPVRKYIRAFPAVPDQVREARRFLAAILTGCPAADDAILCLSELASNCVLHSASRQRGGQFTVRAEVGEGNFVRIELRDNGGLWIRRPNGDNRPHGLDIVRHLAAESGVRGDALTGWLCWATLSWHGNGR